MKEKTDQNETTGILSMKSIRRSSLVCFMHRCSSRRPGTDDIFSIFSHQDWPPGGRICRKNIYFHQYLHCSDQSWHQSCLRIDQENFPFILTQPAVFCLCFWLRFGGYRSVVAWLLTVLICVVGNVKKGLCEPEHTTLHWQQQKQAGHKGRYVNVTG